VGVCTLKGSVERHVGVNAQLRTVGPSGEKKRKRALAKSNTFFVSVFKFKFLSKYSKLLTSVMFWRKKY
jgi:hypothetical protein